MHKLVTRTHPVLFISALVAGLTAVIYFPHLYPDQLVEIPMAALISGEVGLALLLTLLFYEHASSQHIVKLSCTVLSFSMFVGAAGNFAGSYMGLQTQFLPDAFVLISWIQLAIMNVTGLLATLTLFKLRSPDHLGLTDRPLKSSKEEPPVQADSPRKGAPSPPPVEDFTPPAPAAPENIKEALLAEKPDAARPESVKEILEQLDISRINRLERSLHPEAVSLETLFKEETEAARTARSGDSPAEEPPAPAIALTLDSRTKLRSDAAAQVEAKDQSIISLPGDIPLLDLAGSGDSVIPLPASKTLQPDQITSPVAPEAPEDKAEKKAPAEAPQALPKDVAKTVRGLKLPPPEAVSSTSSESPAAPPAAEAGQPEGTTSGAKDELDTDLKALLRGLKEGIKDEPVLPKAVPQPASFAEEPRPEQKDPVSKPAAAKTQSSSSILGDVGSELDDIFAKMAPAAAQDVSAEKLSKLRDKQLDPDDSEFDFDADSDTDLTLASAQATEIKEFGRLSASTSKSHDGFSEIGTMKTIGKMLLDSQAVENIIKQGETRGFRLSTARVLTASQGQDLQALLNQISLYPGISGSLIIGHDGLVMASNMQEELDKDVAAAMSMAIFGNSNLAARKLELGTLSQMVLQSKNRVIILTEVGEGVLVAFTRSRQVNRLNATIAAILKSIQGEPLPDADEIADEIADEQDDEPAQQSLPAMAPPTISQAEASVPAGEGPPAELDVEAEEIVLPPPPEEDAIELAESNESEISILPVVEEPEKEPVQIQKAPEVIAAAEPAAATRPITASSPIFSVSKDSIEQQMTTQQRAAIAASQVHDLLAELEASQQLPVIQPQKAPEMKADPEMEAAPPSTAKEIPATTEMLKETPAPQVPADSQVKEGLASTQATEVKEFGRLSAASGQRAESQEGGTMKTIGKMLIDVQAVGNIINAGEEHARGLTTARVISAARGEGIRSLLAQIDHCSGVVGSLIVGHDGLVIASTLGAAMDKDVLGAMTSSLHSNTNLATNKLELGNLRQMVLQSPDKMTLLTEVDVGVLAVFVEHRELDKLPQIMAAIQKTISG